MKLNDYQALLKTKGITDWQSEAIYLLELATGWSKVKILTDHFQLNNRQIKILQDLANQRQNLPLAYIKSSKEFFCLDFYVNQQVLIPRPESENLVELALKLKIDFKQAYDIGCGCGCLGISYAKHRNCQLILVDKCPKALKVAQINCQKHNIDNVQLQSCDLIADAPKLQIAPQSLILANLPYLDVNKRQTYESACPELKTEPSLALYTQEQGLKLYKHLFQSIKNQPLHVICETLIEQQPQLEVIAKQAGFKLIDRLELATSFALIK
ncbi:MAG: peptide chain release factor N(5)-glutamine methyltransferase [Candidatus Saccharibacteria bacterium]|nr:peptide chain release factor N(5)-glutamine methyltransferase [Candidatus Saccharibacteria bacterium]